LATLSFMIYLDHNATTPVLLEVLEAMMPSKEVYS
jgi:cysteine sulfinate desulfinase/cysteine desulfurase-like protein